MPQIYYDLHLHSCLSPCGDNEMTPNNLVNMAKLLGYDMIALTDHNSCLNTNAAVKAGERVGLLVVPGMELCTQEEVHVVCLFPTVKDAMEFHDYVTAHSIKFKNKPEIFGRQIIMDEEDYEIGEEENLLISATNISVNKVFALTHLYNGTAFPAHVDKSSYSILSNLGTIPPEAGFFAVEISGKGDKKLLIKTNTELNGKMFLCNSDSHYLENMPEPKASLDLPERTINCLISALNGEIQVSGNI